LFTLFIIPIGVAKVPLVTLLSVITCRLLILPLLGLVVVMGGYVWLRAYQAPDPVFLLVMLIQNTAPTAILVHTMAAVHQNKEAEVSALLFWQYFASIVTLPPYLTLFLYLVGKEYHGL
jgi:predicted permease